MNERPRHQAILVGVMKQLKSIEFITNWTRTRTRATVCMAINQQLKRHIWIQNVGAIVTSLCFVFFTLPEYFAVEIASPKRGWAVRPLRSGWSFGLQIHQLLTSRLSIKLPYRKATQIRNEIEFACCCYWGRCRWKVNGPISLGEHTRTLYARCMASVQGFLLPVHFHHARRTKSVISASWTAAG